jgi:colanic acid/amylovoran biosynthesis glycosyltransferase
MKVAYVVSRFPLVTQTFILRELDRLDRLPEFEVELHALFPGGDAVVHEDARRWLARCRHTRPLAALAATGAWTIARPRTVARVFAHALRHYAASPRMLAKTLVTAFAGMQHARAVRAADVTHVHAHFATYPAFAAWVIAQLTGVTYSVTPHAHDIFIAQTGMRPKLAAAAGVVAVSDYHWMYLQHFGARPERLWRIRYGIDVHTYAFRARELPAEGPLDVLLVSSFKPYKGHRVLLAALALGDELRRLRIELIGAGPLETEIRGLAERLGVGGQLRFAGARDQTYVRERLAQAHLLVQPSIVQDDGDTEGLPNTLIEAAAAGVPAVGTRVAGVPELIEDGVTGFLAEQGSPVALRDALLRALAAGSALERITREARSRVERDHDLDAVVRALGANFTQVAGAPAPR